MTDSTQPQLVLHNRHTGERLTMTCVRRGNEAWFALEGSLPPHRDGPPMHVHFAEDEEGRVTVGTVAAIVQDRRVTAGPGQSTSIRRGAAHR